MTSTQTSRLEVPSSSNASQKLSSSSTPTIYHSMRLPQNPELHRVIALYDYHDVDNRNFQFDIGDEISVREHCDWRFWLGINLRTNKIGIFPPSHVKNVMVRDGETTTSLEVAEGLDKDIIETRNETATTPQIDRERSHKLIKSKKEATERFNERFNSQYDSGTSPRAVLNILKRMETFDVWDFWLCFCLVYPDILQHVAHLHLVFEGVRTLLNQAPKEDLNLFLCASERNTWNFSSGYKFLPGWGYKQWRSWESVKERLRIAIHQCSEEWEGFKRERSSIRESFNSLDRLTESLDGLVADLQSQLVKMEVKVQSALESDAKEVREEERRYRKEIVEMGLSKTGSWSSSIEFPARANNMRNRTTRNSRLEGDSAQEKTPKPFHRRIKDKVLGRSKEPFDDQYQEPRTIWNILGGTPAVLTIVICLTVASAVTTALATWQCAPPDKIPIVDSNFWSTLSSAVVGIASLYCTIIPLLLGQKIEVEDENLFRRLLWGSLFFAFVAVIVYPFQTRVSLVVLSISSYAQLATTLQLILGAVQKIVEQADKIEELENPGRVRNVRRRR